MRLFIVMLCLAPFFEVSAFDPSQQDDSQGVVRCFVVPINPVVPENQQGTIRPAEDETIALIGGAMVTQMEAHGFFESAIQVAYPGHRLQVRNLGWPGDTVYRQQRPMFFYTEKGDATAGSLPDQREKIVPGTIVVAFGRMESLDGVASLEKFKEAYRGLLQSLGKLSSRLVVVEPVSFAEAGPAAELAEERNAVLAIYQEAVRKLAEEAGARMVRMSGFGPEDFARNGIDLNESGQFRMAEQLAAVWGASVDRRPALLEAIRAKDQLWNQYHRPTNWAFLFGDRQHVPSSRDNENSDRRWFVEEIQALPGLISAADSIVWTQAKGAGQ
jgi:hypothetical protein